MVVPPTMPAASFFNRAQVKTCALAVPVSAWHSGLPHLVTGLFLNE